MAPRRIPHSLANNKPFRNDDMLTHSCTLFPGTREQRLLVGIVKGNDVSLRHGDDALLWRLANAHGVLPILANHIRQSSSPAWSDSLRKQVLDVGHYVAARNLALLALLNRIGSSLEKSRLPWIALKGPVFTTRFGTDIAARVSGDLDILVPPEAVFAAAAALESEAILSDEPLRPAVRRFGVLPHEHRFFSSSPRFLVELHWSLASDCYSIVPTNTAFDRKCVVTAEGANYPVLSPEDSLLYACMHGFGHRWERLSMACNVAAIVNASTNRLDWDYVVAAAQKARKQRAVALAFALAQEITDIRIPDSPRRIFGLVPSVSALRNEALTFLACAPSPVSSVRILWFKMRGLETAQDRLGLLGRVCSRLVPR